MLIRCVMWYAQSHVTFYSISNRRYRLDIKSLIPYIRIVLSRERHTLHDRFVDSYISLISQFHGDASCGMTMLLLSLQYHESALMVASKNGHTEIVKHLVEAQASLESGVSWPSNPYFYIALCSHEKDTTHHCFIKSYTLHFNFTLHANKKRHVV